LLHQTVWNEDESISSVVEQELPEHHARLDSLAEPDLVSEQITLHRVGKDPARGTDLMRMNIDPRRPDPGQSLSGGTLAQNVAYESRPTVVKIPALDGSCLQESQGIIDRMRPPRMQFVYPDVLGTAVREVDQVRLTARVAPIYEADEPVASVVAPHPLVLFELFRL
jgi:hypothetical protein